MQKYSVSEIRKIMESEGLTKTQMAKRLGVKLCRLSCWLNGTKSPSTIIDTLEEALARLPKLSDAEYAWMAGFIEADGCISIMKSGGRNMAENVLTRFGVTLVVNQKDPRPIQILVRAFGGSVRTTLKKHESGDKRYFVWALRANQAYAALVCLLPFLKVKRPQALLAMTLLEDINSWRGTYGKYSKLPASVSAKRRELYFQNKHLNSQSYIEELNTASGEFGGSLSALKTETIPSQAAEGIVPAEGVTASSLSPNNNENQERPTHHLKLVG